MILAGPSTYSTARFQSGFPWCRSLGVSGFFGGGNIDSQAIEGDLGVFGQDRVRRAAEQAEDDRYKEERSESCEREAADDRAAEGRVLFATFTQRERHRQ